MLRYVDVSFALLGKWQILSRFNMFIVFLYFVVLLCFYWLNITVAVILLYWPHVRVVVPYVGHLVSILLS